MDGLIERFLREGAEGDMPCYLARRILGEAAEVPRASRHYLALAAEQRADGGFGRFHTMDTKDKTKLLFRTTEFAAYRMRDLMLPPGDPLVRATVQALVGYTDGSLNYSDRIERHFGFEIALASLAAANASALGGADKPVRQRKRRCAREIEAAIGDIRAGAIDLEAWKKRGREWRDFLLWPETVHMLWLLIDNAYIEPEAERDFLQYLWTFEKGVYYVSGFPPARFQALESGRFHNWLHLLEQFAPTRAFPALMDGGARDFLEGEALRLVKMAADPPMNPGLLGRYWEGRRGAAAQRWELVARVARLLRGSEAA